MISEGENLRRREANYRPLTPIHFLVRSADVFPDRAAVIDGSRCFTWRQYADRCLRLASALRRRGIAKGDTIAVLAPNTSAMLEAHFGIPMAGAVICALNVRLDASTLAFILGHSEAKILLVNRQFAGLARRSLSRSTGSEARGVYRIRLDVTDFAAVQNAVAAAVSRFGCVDILVNNAGWDMAKPFVETAPDCWDKVIAVNLKGPLNLHRAVLPHMLRTGEGKIINIGSDAGRVGSCGEAVYSACKGGLIAFTKTIARECATKNIVVNAVCPGPTDTPLLHSFAGDGEYGKRIFDRLQQAIPLKRLGQPADLPGVIAFLASDDANFITGQTISVSGGLTMHG
jgi:2-hydroxycyclohexanecarboxyl-CoA dehydrogenase